MALEKTSANLALTRPVFLVGFMGAGKSSIGRSLASRICCNFVDADDYLEEQEGRSIASIFAQEGEDAFRDMESKYLHQICTTPCIVSTGGGVVKRAENIAFMKETGFVVYLHVTAEAAAARIPDSSSRPLFKDLETARQTLAEREPLYRAAANASVDTVGRPVPRIAKDLVRILRENRVLQYA